MLISGVGLISAPPESLPLAATLTIIGGLLSLNGSSKSLLTGLMLQ